MRSRWLLVLFALVAIVCGSLETAYAQTSSVDAAAPFPWYKRPVSPLERIRAQAQSFAGTGQKMPAAQTAHPLTSGANTPNFAGFYSAPFVETAIQGSLSAMVSGDFNHDGIPDVAVVGYSQNITVLPGGGKSGFGVPILTASDGAAGNSSLQGVIVADLNGDGYDDLILELTFFGNPSNELAIRMNKKDGTFASSTLLFYPNTNPQTAFSSMTVGKITASSHPDIFVVLGYAVDFSQVGVQRYINDGAGNFTAAALQTLSVPATEVPFGAVSAVLNDVDGDGNSDLVVEEDAVSYPRFTDFVNIFSGKGDGTFANADPAKVVTFPSPTQNDFPLASSQFLMQSLTGDSKKADLIVSNASGVYVALSNGDGTYQTPQQLVSPGAEQVQFADLNGDGKLDLIATGVGTLVSYLGNGDGTFGDIAGTAAASGLSYYETHAVTVVGDFDGDGKQDFVNADSGGNVEFAHGWGDGSFAAAPLIYSSVSPEFSPIVFAARAAADVNGDGLDDVVAQNINDGAILSAISKPGGGFTFLTGMLQSATSAWYLTGPVADFNGDGKPDLVVEDLIHDTLAVALSNGDGTFQLPITGVKTSTKLSCVIGAPAVGDVNGDGKMDLVFAYGGDATCTQNTATVPSGFFVALGNGDGTFAPALFQATGSDLFLAGVGRFHGANKPLDLVVSDSGYPHVPSVSLFQGNGDGTFGNPTTIESGRYIGEILTDDFNGDGKSDITLVAQNIGPGGGTFQYAGNGDGTFAAPVDVFSDLDGTAMYSDVNNDGILDIVGLEGNGLMAVLLGTGKGQFAQPTEYYTGGAGQIFAGHFQGDNSVGVVGEAQYDLGTMLFRNQGGTTLAVSANLTTANAGDEVIVSQSLVPTVAGLAAPTGTVTFFDGTTQIGSGPVATAAVVTTTLAVGTHTITAKYSGDGLYYANTSAAITVTVVTPPPPPAPDFTFSSSASTLSVAKGASGTLTMTVGANASLNAAMTFSCSGLPSEAACVFSPSSLTVAAGASGTATVTVSTKAASTNARAASKKAGSGVAGGFAGMGVVAGLALFVLPKRRAWLLPLVLVAFGGLAGLSGCGGGGSTTITPVDPGTPTGTTNVTVTATAVAGSTTVTHTSTVALTVQ